MKRKLALFISCAVIMQSISAAAETLESSVQMENMTQEEYGEWKESINESGEIELLASDTEISNEFLKVIVNKNGKFIVRTTGGDPDNPNDDNKRLLYGSSPWSSFTTIRINNKNYVFSANEVNAVGNSKIVASENISGITVNQIIEFVSNPNTGNKDNLLISYEIINNSDTEKNAGARIMMDTQLGSNDGAPFRIARYGDCTTEVEFSGDNIPQTWQAYDSLTNPTIISSGTFFTSSADKPDKVQFTRWGGVYGTSWNYQVTEGKSLTGDSAVAVYYNSKPIAAGQKVTCSTRYGLSSFNISDNTPPVAAAISAPKAIELNTYSTAYTPEPLVTAYLENISAVTANNVVASIELPDGIALKSGQNKNINIGNMAAGEEKQVSWELDIPLKNEDRTFNYKVRITADNMPEKVLNLSISTTKRENNQLNVGDYFYLGSSSGSIIWRCIAKDEKGCLMISDNILDYRPYDAESNAWSTSDIREWLNDRENGFLKHFSDTELDLILETENKEILPSDYSVQDENITGSAVYIADSISDLGDYDSAISTTAKDYIFLPSVKDLNNIYLAKDVLGDEYYLSEPTYIAEIRYNGEHKNNYWLQTPYNKQDGSNSVCTIETNDEVVSRSAISSDIGVRPEFYLDIDNAILKNGSGTLTEPYSIYEKSSGGSGDDEEKYRDDRDKDTDSSKGNGGGGSGIDSATEEIVYEDGVFVDLPTLASYNIKNTEGAIRAAENFISKIEADENLSFDDSEVIKQLTIFVEECIAQAAAYNVNNSNIKISNNTILRLSQTAETAKSKMEKLLSDKGIEPDHELRKDITIKTNSSIVSLSLDENIEGIDIDNINIEAPSYNLSFSRKLIEESSDGFKISSKAISNSVTFDKNKEEIDDTMAAATMQIAGVQVTLNNPSRENVIVSLPRLSGSADTQAMTSTSEAALVSSYNYPKQEIQAKTRDSGTFFVKNNIIDFSDIENLSETESAAIKYLASKGIATGTGNGKYSPDTVLSRAQFTALLLKSIGEYDSKISGNGGFKDVSSSSWIAPVVASAKKCGIISGYQDNTFRPDSDISKEQVYQVLGQAYITSNTGIKISSSEVSRFIDEFTDKNMISQYARNNIALSRKRNIITLGQDGKLNPNQGLTRAEAAVIIKKFFDDIPFKTNR